MYDSANTITVHYITNVQLTYWEIEIRYGCKNIIITSHVIRKEQGAVYKLFSAMLFHIRTTTDCGNILKIISNVTQNQASLLYFARIKISLYYCKFCWFFNS